MSEDAGAVDEIEVERWFEEDASAKLNPRRHTVRSRLTLPLVGRGESVGAISLGSTRAHRFTQTHITLLSSVASLAGVVYWNLEDVKALEAQLALTRAQREELRRLSAPILEVAPGVLLVPLVGRLHVDVALHWQRWRLDSPVLDRLTDAVRRAATVLR